MRIIMMGTGPFAVPTFRDLLDSPHELAALFTRPVPPPTGRRRASAAPPNPMRDVAVASQLEIQAPVSVNDPEVVSQLATLEADLFVVCDYGQILSRDALAAARLGGINLHGSLLPKYRGAAPVNWALYHGERETGVTVIHMTPRLDAGPSLVQESLQIDADIDAVELEHQLAQLGVGAVRTSISMLAAWDGKQSLGQAQDSRAATRAPRLMKADGIVDWRRGAEPIRNQVRAFQPWPGSFTYWKHPHKGSLRLVICRVSVVDCDATSADAPGRVAEATDRLVIDCGQGQLAIEEVQPAGKRKLPISEFLRGYPIRPGDQLGDAEI